MLKKEREENEVITKGKRFYSEKMIVNYTHENNVAGMTVLK
jgi:hypothetical protein